MANRRVVYSALLALIVAFTMPAAAQQSAESAVKGGIEGTVLDTSGAVVPGASVTLSGPTGARTVSSDERGDFTFPLLTPGTYSVKVEKQGFKTASIPNIQVFTDRKTAIRVTLEPGAVSQTVEVTAGVIAVDTTSTAIGANLNDDFYKGIPIQRGVASLFNLAAGVAPGGRAGAANPSISGGSALENQYIADSVDITDTAFGGLGVFSRVYLSLATGINLSFVKEVQVKTGGYEPQYGKATGGIVQIVTKSGGNTYHGTISAFAQPNYLEARRLNADDPRFGRTNLVGRLVHVASFDATAELGGYIPHFKDKLFFFASFNPSEPQQDVLAPPNSGLFRLGDQTLRTLTYNYAVKGTWKFNDNHQVESSIFSDPSHTPVSAFNTLNIDNTTAFSKLVFGTRNWVVRYNGSVSPTWLVNGSFTWGYTYFNEKGFANLQEILDQTQTAGLPGQRGAFRAVGLGFTEPTQGNTFGANIDTSKTINALGRHTFSIGYRLERAFYDGSRGRSGPTYTVPQCNADNPSCTTAPAQLGPLGPAIGTQANAVWRLLRAPSSCTLCPFFPVPGIVGPGPGGTSRVLLRIFRSEFGLTNGVKPFATNLTYHAAYLNDSWNPSKYITLNLGLRWENERMEGQDVQYSFTGNWSPRIGVAVDPFGDRKTKIFGNFARYHYTLPLDLAERSLTNEFDAFGLRTAPEFTTDTSGNRIAVINQFGTVNPVVDAAHTLNGASGGVTNTAASSFESTEPIFPGTKLSYEDEWVVGVERQLKGGVIVSAKYIRRDLKRIVEDTGGISPEATLAGVNQQFAITNVRANTDIFTNPVQSDFIPNFVPCGGVGQPACGTTALDTTTMHVNNIPAGCDPFVALFPVVNSLNQPVTDASGNTAACFADNGVNGQVAGSVVADGIPDGFVDPVRQYWAVEFEANKTFSHNWQLRANWRIARLVGNFEGAFRNDNGQTDPGISSLFDFTQGNFNLLGDQFKPGPLNTDRFHILNIYATYVFDKTRLKGLTLGTGVRYETGTPISEFASHPVYENAGEVPLGGRGKLGRTRQTGTVDIHVDYPIRITEGSRLHFGADFFNIVDSRRLLFVDQNIDLSFGVPNVDFQKPVNQNGFRAGDAFLSPFRTQVFFRFEF